MGKRRWASPGEAEEIGEVYRCMTFEEYKDRTAKAEREVEQGHKDLRDAEKRLTRMAEKVEATKHDTGGLVHELNEAKKQLDIVAAKCARWKGRSVELQRTLRRVKAREFRGPKGISNAVKSAMTALAKSGKPLSPPGYRVEGRVYEMVNELVFTWRLPTVMILGIVDSVSRATVDVCYGGHVDDVDIDMGEHYEFSEHEHEREGSPVVDAAVEEPSNAVVPSSEEPSGGERA